MDWTEILKVEPQRLCHTEREGQNMSEEGLLHLWLEPVGLWGEFCHPKVTFCMFSAQFLTVPYCLSLGNGRQKQQCHGERLLLPF